MCLSKDSCLYAGNFPVIEERKTQNVCVFIAN
jgi:hypothetical protein